MLSVPKFHWMIAAIGLTALAACSTNDALSPTQSKSPLSDKAAATRPVTDLPIPTGAHFDAERSLILSGQDEWTGRLVMETEVSATVAYAFYSTEMPRFEWTPVMSVQAGTSVLTYTRDNRAATVQIERKTLGGTVITITVARRHEQVVNPAISETPLNPPVQEVKPRN